jgi:cobaltochelatase CobS
VSQPVAPATVPEDQLAAAVEAAIAERFGSQLQAMEQKLEQAASQAAEQAAREAMQGRTVTRVEIHDRKTGTIRPLEEATHFVVPKIVQALQAGCNVWLVGPTGTGKTHIAIQVAKIMGLDFEGISLTTGTPVSEIKGYRDANGNFQDTGYFRVFTKGGLILLDEADNGHPNTLGVGNQGFSNGVMSFPDGQMHTRHEEAYCLTSANTAGTGADSQYSGRNKLDAAFLKRFVHIDVPIDLALEEHVTRSLVNNQDLASWSLQAVREVRAASERLKLPITFSPRECYDTAKLLQAGFTKDDVARMSIRKDVSPDDWAKVTPGTILDGLGKTVSSR